uniref:Uncharacterized protein n=1 Tax=Mus spicilegus TaxID=10103 RepID=A0A8C6H443_MUSSI
MYPAKTDKRRKYNYIVHVAESQCKMNQQPQGGLVKDSIGVQAKGRRGSGSMSSFSRAPQQWATFARMWYLLDGKMQPPGKLAVIASNKLQGFNKPVYHQLTTQAALDK